MRTAFLRGKQNRQMAIETMPRGGPSENLNGTLKTGGSTDKAADRDSDQGSSNDSESDLEPAILSQVIPHIQEISFHIHTISIAERPARHENGVEAMEICSPLLKTKAPRFAHLVGRKQQPVVGVNRNRWVYNNVSGVYIVVPNVSGVYIVVHNLILCQQQCRSEITLL